MRGIELLSVEVQLEHDCCAAQGYQKSKVDGACSFGSHECRDRRNDGNCKSDLPDPTDGNDPTESAKPVDRKLQPNNEEQEDNT